MRSVRRMEAAIRILAGITEDEVNQLATAAGINNGNDLAQAEFIDIQGVLSNGAQTIKCRRLHNIGKYIRKGNTVEAATTMDHILEVLNGGGNTANANTGTSAVDRGAPKVSINPLKEYDGNIMEFQNWKLSTEALLGQTDHGELLTSPPTPGDQIQEKRNKELYNMIKNALLKSSVYHLVEKVTPNDGHAAYTAIVEWHEAEETSRLIINTTKDRLENLILDDDNDANDFINDFLLYTKRLEDKGEGLTAKSKVDLFLRKIVSEEYKVTREICTTSQFDFDKCVEEVRKKSNALAAIAVNDRKIRRGVTSKDNENNNTMRVKIPSFPKACFDAWDKDMRRDMLRWRSKWNKEGKTIREEDLLLHQRRSEGKETSSNSPKGGSGKGTENSRGKSGRDGIPAKHKRNRRTMTTTSGTPNSTLKVLMKDEKELKETDEISMSSSDEGDDSNGNQTTGHDKVAKKPPPKKKKNRRVHVDRRSTATSTDKPRNIVDPGCEVDVVCRLSWHVLHVHDNIQTQLQGPLPGMGTRELPMVQAVTAYDAADGRTILIGTGMAAYDDSPSQTESLFNSHDMRKHGVIVHDIAERDGGLQRIEIDGIHIGLDFVEEKTLSFDTRKPTKKELDELEIHWLCPRTPASVAGLQPLRRFPAAVVADVPAAEWEKRLGYCPEKVTVKTLEATTQLCSSPVEMENREAPRQHRKQRLIPLHPKRISGRTDSDTFFASVKSVRGFTCVQLFFVTFANFLYARCMRKESHSHGAYQDFVRDVGAPNHLLTDNAKTETGKKWTQTSRANATRQTATVPHNQNQNQAERKIRDVKNRVMLTLRYANAPLVFWCYCLMFIVDCLNHTAHRGLGWRTPKERIDGETPDISVFRFYFWQPVWYYEPTAKYPSPNFLPGRFVGIAWDHGDAFTYKIWTEPDNDWTKGTELIRNIVKPRGQDVTQAAHDHSGLGFQRKDADKQRSRKGKRKRPTGAAERQQTSQEERAGRGVRFSELSPQIIANGKDAEETGAEQPTTPTPATIHTSTSTQPEEPIVTDPTSRDQKRTHEMLSSEVQSPDDEARYLMEGYDPFDEGPSVDMGKEVYDSLSPSESATVGGGKAVAIAAHDWREGRLRLKVVWSTDDTSWEELRDMKEDYPRMTAQYIVKNEVTRSTRDDRTLAWAKNHLRNLDRAVRRIVRLYDFYLDGNDEVYSVRRAQNRKRKKAYNPQKQYKFGVQVPRNVREALELDKANGNTLWEDAIKLEVQTLTDMECFEFKPSGHDPGAEYQKTILHMVWDVKQDLRRKARLVAGGHLVDALDHDIYSSTVKGISVRLLHVIAHKAGLEQLCGDVGNAYVNAFTNERVYAIAGPEFGELEGQVIIIRKALYGLRTSSERWYCHCADTLRGLEFEPTRYDRDVWIRKSEDGTHYEYICTHVDDFMIVSKRPDLIMEMMQAIYKVKTIGPPDYYLGNDYKKDRRGRYCIGCKKYLVEAISRVERMFGTLKKYAIPSVTGDHPEEDTSELLSDDEHRKYQMLIGILVWAVTIGRLDVAHPTTSLSRFTASPRKGHLERLLRVFGYLKKRVNRRIVVDSRDPIYIGGEEALQIDFTEELGTDYPGACEEVDTKLPEPLVDEMAITVFVDSDHAHDKVTRRSITGIIIFVGRTPVFYSSKRQGAIETSTYSAEFCAMKTAVEETIAVRYMLRCLGVKVDYASTILGDNLGVIQNSSISESLLKKKHVAISYHKVREAAAAGIVHPVKTDGADNFADILTKAQESKTFARLVGGVMHG